MRSALFRPLIRISAGLLLASALRVSAQPAPTGDVELALRKLNELGTVLMIAAHPDDERTNVLAYFARGRHMRTAYLSITRGEGGQNLIGADQGAALGVIRTQELLSARRIDGAEQFFTRAIDFGFTKTVPETMEKWGREKVLSDIVWVIRRYRPDVVILGFSGTPADGHGQHQASAILGKEAFEAAGDPSRFPEQLKYVQPWRATKLVYAGGFGGPGRGGAGRGGPQQPPIAPAAPVNTTGYSPFLGYSFDQLATLSRSQHRSQGFGNIGAGGGGGGRAGGGRGGQNPRPGRQPVSAPTPPPADLFAGIDHSWSRLPGGEAVGNVLNQAIREFDAEHPEKTLPLLAKARPLIAAIDDPLAKIKLAEIDEVIAKCAGLWAEAIAARSEVTPGAKVRVTTNVYARLPVDLKVQSIQPEGKWTAPVITAFEPRQGGGVTAAVDLEVPAEEPYSQPYWLEKPPVGDRYTVEKQMLAGLADTPVEQVRIRLTVGGIPIELLRPIENRFADRAEAERIRPITVIPRVSVNLSSGVAMFPSATPRNIHVIVHANVPDASGTLKLEMPSGWKSEPVSQSFKLPVAGEERDLSFEITPPAAESTGKLRAIATVAGREIAVGMNTISYPHIPIDVLFPRAEVKLVRADIHVSARRIGYIMGAGDEVPDALRQLGLEVTMLGESDLIRGDLSRFDAIVAGVRAYNVRADLRANQSRLMEYVKNGGTYVVQYMSAGAENIGPYKINIPAGNAYRVTVEESPVTFTHPDSRLLQYPNHITSSDFAGWIQERGLLFPTEWDPKYETVLSSGDPGEKPLNGGELWTHYGKGVYIFSAYVWFRELPAGVPGAYRLFANMLSAR
ncbi:MAG TPA: PIG-L family deacetylase [Bryobacteraceae bacterium]|nr:PIG-L family deacetylase [Bryobacteraceae bacterium]